MNDIIRYRKRPYIPVFAQSEPTINEKDATTLSDNAVNIKNYHADSRLKKKEFLLNHAVRDNECLSAISCVTSFNSWDQRLQLLGMAVTVIDARTQSGRVKTCAAAICDDFIKYQSVNIKIDPVLNMRGLAFLYPFLATETAFDATSYALGLRVGADAQNNILDDIYIDGFQAIWNARLELSGY